MSDTRAAILARKLLPSVLLAASRGLGVGLQLLLQVVVGALTGPAGLGTLQLFSSWSNVAGEVLSRGQPATVMRTVSVEYKANNPSGCWQVTRDAAAVILRLSLPALAVGALLIGLLNHILPGIGQTGMWLAVLVAAPLFALGRVFAEGLKGSDNPLLALTLENSVLPAVILLACLGTWLLQRDTGSGFLLPAGVVGFALASATMAWTLSHRLLVAEDTSPAYTPLVDRREQRTFWAGSLVGIVYTQLPFLILPFFASMEEIGVFTVAHKLVNVITTLLLLQTAIFGPAFARENSSAGKKALLRRTQCLSLAIFTPIGILLLLVNAHLATLFSLENGSLFNYLAILLVGQLINAATGLPGVMMMMSGAAVSELRSLMTACLIATFASPLIGHWYGPLGLACLFSAVIATKNIIAYVLAHRFLLERKDQ